MRIAWDDNRYFWSGLLFPDNDGCWRMKSDKPLRMGGTVTITPLGGNTDQIQFRARVIAQREDVLVAPFDERRFESKLVALDLPAAQVEDLYTACVRA